MNKVLFALSLLIQLWIRYNIVNSEIPLAESANQIECISDNDTLVIRGDNIRLSDLSKNDDCIRGIFSFFISTITSRKIYIYALNTIYIDIDLPTKGQKLMIYMIAPRWFIEGTRTFDLRGLNGESFEKSADGFYSRTGNGKNGKPGKPGDLGGLFFGINSEIVNSEFLTIDVGGGDGGKGQDGASGRNGKNGSRAYVHFAECSRHLCDHNRLIAKNEDGNLESFYCEQQIYEQYIIFAKGGYVSCFVYLVGKQPMPPGDGGHGGKCGKGGFPGKVTLLQLQNTLSKVKTKNETGKGGELGLGGLPGQKSYYGLWVKYHGEIKRYFDSTKIEWREQYTKPDSRLPAIGKRGKDGGNDEKPPDPEPARFPILEYKAINYYKSYLIDNLKHNDTKVKNSSLKIFLENLNTRDSINELYDALALGEELLLVEKKRVFLSNDLDFLYLYTSLKHRIIKFAEKLESNTSNEDTKLLTYMISATVSKIYNLKDHSESRLIIDVPAFLDLAYNNICDLDDLKNKGNKLRIVVQKLNKINDYKDQYKNKLDGKIAEAKKIAEELVDEIHNINDEIDKTVQSLIGEIKSLEIKEEQNKVAIQEYQAILKEKLSELREQIVSRGIFEAIKFLAPFGLLFGKIGMLASAFIQSMSGVSEPMILDPASNNFQNKDLEVRIKSVKEMMKKMNMMEIERLDSTLNKLREEAKGVQHVLDDLVDKVTTIQKALSHVKNYHDIKNIERQLGVELERQRKKLINGTAGYDKAIKVLDKFEKVTQLSPGAFDTYISISSNVKDGTAVDNALEESKLLFERLKQLELNIRNILSPQLAKMEDRLDEMTKKLGENSKISLDVTKWKVQELLKKAGKQIYVFVGELKSELRSSKRLEAMIHNLKNTMNMLIKLYDHIQNYEEGKYLSDYLADLTSAAAMDINITNLEYRNITNQLDITISSNVIMQEHTEAINAFKQFVFPVADNYLKYFELPSQLELKYDLDGLVSRSKDQIKLLKNKLTEYQGAIFNEDKCITKGYFYNDHKITAPFYTWDGRKDEDTLRKMLAGKEIAMRADVVNSPVGFDAIKFTFIKLNFTSPNETFVREIEEKMNFYEISMSHLGDSYYRLGNKYYRIDTDITEFSYSYKRELNGEPTFISASYDKLKNGQLMLSPYALWRVKLRRYPPRRLREITSHLNSNFTLSEKSLRYDENRSTGLETFAKELIIEMVGKGSFIDVTKKDCNDFNVDKYYKPINITY